MSLAQITIIEPESIIKKLGSQYIYGSTATFGTPYYGSRLLASLKFKDTKGCDEESYSLENEDSIATVVAVWREDCSFIQKTMVAEKKGAKAIIIIDSPGSGTTFNEVRRIILSKGNSTEDVEIPALLIGEVEGKAIIEASEASEDIIVDMTWSMPKFQWAEFDLWMSPSLEESVQFLEKFYPYAMILKDKLGFFPHYWVVSLHRYYPDKCWNETRFYCSYNAEWDSNITGKEILEETVRQICLYDSTYKDNNGRIFSEKWWEYVAKLRSKCIVPTKNGKSVFGEKCSYELMTFIGVDANLVKKCFKESAQNILANERMNEAWSPTAALINGWHYSGSLEADTVAKAVCTAFKDPSPECKEIFSIANENSFVSGSGGIGALSIVFISLVVSLIAMLFIGLTIWKFIYPKFRNNMRYAVMNEVHKELNKQQGFCLEKIGGIGNPSHI